jgi:hypothetical protein
VADQRHLVIEGGFEKKGTAPRNWIQGLILRLELERAEPEFLGTALHLGAEFFLGDKWIEARRAGEAVRMGFHGFADQVVSPPVVVDDGERDQQRPLDAVSVHVLEHAVRRHDAAAVPRNAEMGVGIENLVALNHGCSAIISA